MVTLYTNAVGVCRRGMFESEGTQNAIDNRAVSLKIPNMLIRNCVVLK